MIGAPLSDLEVARFRIAMTLARQAGVTTMALWAKDYNITHSMLRSVLSGNARSERLEMAIVDFGRQWFQAAGFPLSWNIPAPIQTQKEIAA